MIGFRLSALWPALLLLLATQSGCGAGTTVNGNMSRQGDDVAITPNVPPDSVSLPFREIPGTRAQTSGHLEANRAVIRDVAEWGRYWGKIVDGVFPIPPMPTVDFERQVVLAAAMGQRPSGGFTIAIDAVFLKSGTVYVVVKSVAPGPNCGVAAVMTAPVVAAAIDRVDSPVRFVEKLETTDCR